MGPEGISFKPVSGFNWYRNLRGNRLYTVIQAKNHASGFKWYGVGCSEELPKWRWYGRMFDPRYGSPEAAAVKLDQLVHRFGWKTARRWIK